MKKLFYLIFALLTCSGATAKERSALKVTFTDGTTTTLCTNYNLSIAQSYDMKTKNFILSISHTDKNLSDYSPWPEDHPMVVYSIEQVKSMQFIGTETDVESLELDNADNSTPAFFLSGKNITVIGVKKNDVAAYSLDGTVPAVVINGTDGRVTLDFSATEPGTYIIKTSTKPIKVRIQ